MALIAFAATAFADTFTGTLIDAMCQDKDLPSHTTKCALQCSASGYGLMAAGKFLKFDAAGNAKALAVLKATSKQNDLQATISGTLDGETLHVDSIDLQ